MNEYDYNRAIRIRAMLALVVSDVAENVSPRGQSASRVHSLCRVMSAVDPCVAMSIALAIVEAHDVWVAGPVGERREECRVYLDLCDAAADAQHAAMMFHIAKRATSYFDARLPVEAAQLREAVKG